MSLPLQDFLARGYVPDVDSRIFLVEIAQDQGLLAVRGESALVKEVEIVLVMRPFAELLPGGHFPMNHFVLVNCDQNLAVRRKCKIFGIPFAVPKTRSSTYLPEMQLVC